MISRFEFAVLFVAFGSSGCAEDTPADTSADTSSGGSTATASTGELSASSDASSESGRLPDGTSDGTSSGDISGDISGSTSGESSTGETSTSSATRGSSGSTDGTGSSESSGGAAAVCGDGIVAGDEVCDDGNPTGDDGCNMDCTVATCLVPITHPSIQAGHDDMACSTVWVMQGTYAENLTLARDITVERVGNGDPVVVDAAGVGRVVDVVIGEVVLRGLTVTGGSAIAGAGIGNASTLTLVDAVVDGNTATGAGARGGGIHNTGDLVLSNTVVSNNVVAGAFDFTNVRGGGIYTEDASLTLQAGTELSGNVATINGTTGGAASGGGLAALDTELTIEAGVAIVANTVDVAGPASKEGSHTARGGGLWVSGGAFEVTGLELAMNVADAHGAGGNAAQGGGLFAIATELELFDTSVLGNEALAGGVSASASGGGIYLGSNVNSLSISGGRVDGNLASAVPGGGMGLNASAFGGGIYGSVSTGTDTKVLTLSESSVSLNRAEATVAGETAGTAEGGAVYLAAGTGDALITMLADRCLFAGNEAHSSGSAAGGAIRGRAATGDARVEILLRNSTVSGCAVSGVSAVGGAISGRSIASSSNVALQLSNATIAGNSAETAGGGVHLNQGGVPTALGVRNSIIAGNTAPSGPACTIQDTSLTSDGYNLFDDVSGCVLDGATAADVVGMASGIAVLSDNGGPTMTHAIDPLSPAYDAGNPGGCLDEAGAALSVDQRGFARPSGAACDIGAFEYAP